MKLKESLRFFLGIPLTILAFIFIGKIFFDSRETIVDALLSSDPIFFISGIICFGVFFFIKSIIWIIILRTRGFSTDSKSTLFRYSLSEAKRYIPGSIFAFISRLDIHKSDVPRKETVKGIGIEALLLSASALFVSVPALLYLISRNFVNHNLQIGFVFLIAIAAIVLFILKTSNLRSLIVSYFDSFALYVLAWIFYGLGSYLIALSMIPLDPKNLTVMISFFTLSWLCGYLLFVTPMGLGIREIVITFALSLFIPLPQASAISIMSRAGMILGELSYLAATKSLADAKNINFLKKINPYFTISIILGFAYFIYFTYFTILRYNAFLTGRFDLGNMAQTIWNTSQGRFFTLTNPDGVEVISRLGVHSDLLLAIISPLYFIWSDPRVLLVFQSLALSLGGIAVFFLARRIVKSQLLATGFVFSYFSNFWLHEQNIFDFHAVTIATPLILFCLYYLTIKRYILFVLFLGLAATTKENVFLTVSVFGAYFMKEKKWIIGSLVILAGLFGFYYLTSVAIPQARGEAHFALGTYSQYGDSTQSIVKNLLLHPQLAFLQLFNWSTLMYLHQHLLPTGYLTLLSPFYLLFVLPDMAIYLLSNNYQYRSYQYHFGALILPFLLIGSMEGTKIVLKKFKHYNLEKGMFYYLIATACAGTYFYSPLPGMRNADYAPFQVKNSQVINDYLTLIPITKSVSASNNIGSHLSHRELIYVVPYGLDTADYIVLFNEKEKILNLVNSMYYDTIIEDDTNHFYLYKRRVDIACTGCLP